MSRVLFSGTVILAMIVWASAFTEEELKKSCGKFLQPGYGRCCQMEFSSKPKRDEKIEEVFKECSQLPGGSPTCEREICVGTKTGIASEDGTIIKSKITEVVEKNFSEFPDLLAAIKDKCINGDISKYGLADICDLRKHEHCVHVQMAANCPKWDDTGMCAGSKDAAVECVKLFQ